MSNLAQSRRCVAACDEKGDGDEDGNEDKDDAFFTREIRHGDYVMIGQSSCLVVNGAISSAAG